MRNFTIGGVIAVVLTLVGVSTATSQTLTPDQIQTAIERGLKSRQSEIGLFFKITQINNARALIRGMTKSFRSRGLDSNHGLEEFGLSVYTPLAWIERQAAKIAGQLRPFSTADVTDEMKRPVLRVFVKPNAQHIVLRDLDKQAVLQSISGKQPFFEPINFGLQWQTDIVGDIMLFEFSLEEVRKLQVPGDGGFYIRVEIGTEQFEEFEVKKKHLKKLPM